MSLLLSKCHLYIFNTESPVAGSGVTTHEDDDGNSDEDGFGSLFE